VEHDILWTNDDDHKSKTLHYVMDIISHLKSYEQYLNFFCTIEARANWSVDYVQMVLQILSCFFSHFPELPTICR